MPAFDRYAAMHDIEVGTFYLHQGNYDAALDRFREAATSYPTYAEPWLLMGQTYEKKGLLADSIKSYTHYLMLYPRAPTRKKLENHIAELQNKLDREKQKHNGK